MSLVEIRGHQPPPPPPPTALELHLQHFHRRALADALLEGTATYWHRRAADFDKVRTHACDLIALNCRHYADLLRESGLDAEAQAAIDSIIAVTAAENPVQGVLPWA